jgi:hypothetical protein
MKKIDSVTKDRMLRAFLRSIPLFPAGPELYDLMISFRKSQNEFDQQVTEAVAALQNTSELVTRLQQGVDERMARLGQLRQEHQRYSELAEIEGKKAEALLSQVELTLGKGQAKERWIALAMHLGVGFLFFVLGVALSDSLKTWAAHLWSKLFF